MKLFTILVTLVVICTVRSVSINTGEGFPLPGLPINHAQANQGASVNQGAPANQASSAATAAAANKQVAAASGKIKSASSLWDWNWNDWGWGWGGGNSYPTPKKHCPVQVDFSADLRLSSSPVGYPVNAITAELNARQTTIHNILLFLIEQIVLPSQPTVPYDPVVATSESSCRTHEYKLWSYTNTTTSGRCWVLQNYQEPKYFVSCATSTCLNSNKYVASDKQNSCLETYRYVQLYVYCEDLPPNARIVPRRIILPVACTCRLIQCYGTWK